MPIIDNIGQRILYEAPAAAALLFVGAAGYIAEGDPAVREQLDQPKDQLKHWRKVFLWGATRMSALVVGGTITAIAAYFQTKNNWWLYGTAAFAGILPYTMFAMGKTNSKLSTILKVSGEADLKEDDKTTVRSSLKKWLSLHTGRVLIGLAAATIFFVAKEQSKNIIIKV